MMEAKSLKMPVGVMSIRHHIIPPRKVCFVRHRNSLEGFQRGAVVEDGTIELYTGNPKRTRETQHNSIGECQRDPLFMQ